MIRDALLLMNVTSRNRTNFLKKQKKEILKRAVTGKLEKETREAKKDKFFNMKLKRDK